ncbi:cell number regulator 1-like [Eucalyptus grandis]|uniref:cell number regulator 1-like n=1 Tax=Eucalyptus grandis TaxID=71139 RepID=UPI00192E7BEF|nr:cell number regulator 1-like [Eucalyptus grandis]
MQMRKDPDDERSKSRKDELSGEKGSVRTVDANGSISSSGGSPAQWTTDLYSCFEDPSNCFITCCCPCITFGQNAEIIDRGATSCVAGGLVYDLLAHAGVVCLYTCSYRTKLRVLHSLQEDPRANCLVHSCCIYYALCQEYRELKNRGFEPSIGWVANVQKMNQGAATMPPMTQGMGR